MSEAPALATSDPPLRMLELAHGPLAYTDEGPSHGPALIAVHGIPGSVRDFRYLAPPLVDAVRLIRVDLPGFGGSAAEKAALRTLPGRARVVLALADALGLDRFAVLGHSLGGGTALVLASRAVSRVTLLALVASIALSRHRGLGMPPWAFGVLARGLRVPLLRRWLLPRVREQYRRRRLPGADEMDAPGLARQLRAIAAADFALLRRAVRGRLPPALVAYARDDHMIETRLSEELVTALARPRVAAFDSGGHNLQKTRALELAKLLRDALL